MRLRDKILWWQVIYWRWTKPFRPWAWATMWRLRHKPLERQCFWKGHVVTVVLGAEGAVHTYPCERCGHTMGDL